MSRALFFFAVVVATVVSQDNFGTNATAPEAAKADLSALPAHSDSLYHPEVFHKSFEAEVDLLRAQVAVMYRKELTVINRNVKNPKKILDLGGGPGWFSVRLANEFPDATVTLIDVDPNFLNFARTHNKDLVDAGRLVAFQDSAQALSKVESASLDLVVCRFVFQHLPNPAAAAAEVFRVLKPGGKLVVIDRSLTPTEFLMPPLPKLLGVFGKFMQFRAEQNPDYQFTGALIDTWFSAAGFKNIQLDAVQIHSRIDIALGYSQLKDYLVLAHPEQFTIIKKLGVVPAEFFDAAVEEFEAFSKDEKALEGFLLASTTNAFIAEKPAN